MAYRARQIAEWFIARSARDGKSLTQMKLQKLVYIAHGWYLALYGEALVEENIEAWKWGPVIRSLYTVYADFGSSPIPVLEPAPRLDDRTEALLEHVWINYEKFSAVELSAMTHATGTPWLKFYRAESPRNIITNDAIKKHYEDLVQARR